MFRARDGVFDFFFGTELSRRAILHAAPKKCLLFGTSALFERIEGDVVPTRLIGVPRKIRTRKGGPRHLHSLATLDTNSLRSYAFEHGCIVSRYSFRTDFSFRFWFFEKKAVGIRCFYQTPRKCSFWIKCYDAKGKVVLWGLFWNSTFPTLTEVRETLFHLCRSNDRFAPKNLKPNYEISARCHRSAFEDFYKFRYVSRRINFFVCTLDEIFDRQFRLSKRFFSFSYVEAYFCSLTGSIMEMEKPADSEIFFERLICFRRQKLRETEAPKKKDKLLSRMLDVLPFEVMNWLKTRSSKPGSFLKSRTLFYLSSLSHFFEVHFVSHSNASIIWGIKNGGREAGLAICIFGGYCDIASEEYWGDHDYDRNNYLIVCSSHRKSRPETIYEEIDRVNLFSPLRSFFQPPSLRDMTFGEVFCGHKKRWDYLPPLLKDEFMAEKEVMEKNKEVEIQKRKDVRLCSYPDISFSMSSEHPAKTSRRRPRMEID